MNFIRHNKAALMGGMGALILASPAMAQSVSGAASSPPQASGSATTSNDNSDQDIVVTAQRRSERLLDAPQSVTALTAADLAKFNATQFVDYANTVPGLQFTTQGPGRTSINLRGVTTGLDVSQTVGIYVDDVPYGSTTIFAVGQQLTLDAALYDLDRVEVLRGPQGTLYGASSIGGVLKYVTREPSLTEFCGSAQGGVSTTRYGGTSYNGNLVANVPIVSDKVAVRASAFYSKSGGYVDNVARGDRDVDGGKIYGGRVDVLLKPTDQLSIRLSGYGQNIRRNGSLYVDYDRATGKPINGDLDQSHPLLEPFNSEFRLASGTVIYDFGPAALTSVTSYQTIKTRVSQDVSSLYAPFFAFLGTAAVSSDNQVSTKKFSQEVRLASSGSSRLDWLIGGFYTNEDSSVRNSIPLYSASGAVIPFVYYNGFIPSRYREYAVFGNATWHLTDKFELGGGIRWAHNKQDYRQDATGLAAIPQAPTTSSESVVTYLANARYHFSHNVMAYARFATGYRPGGPNTAVRGLNGSVSGSLPVQSDKLNSYEIGFKAETADHKFTIDAAAFYLDWSNIQLATVANNVAVYFNGSGARVKGGELTLTARPERGLTFVGAFAYNDGRITEASAALGAAKGERLPNSARFTGTITGDYVVESSPLKPSIGGTVRLVGDRMVSFNGSLGMPQYRLPSYATADIRAGLTIGPVDAQVYVRNLFDARAQLSAQTFLGPAQVAIAQPRTIGISATTRF